MKHYIILALFIFCSCYQEQKTAVHADFEVRIESDYKTVPVQVSITNKSTGGDNYLWTFEGAEPSTFDKEKPGSVLYRSAGTYKIRLEVWNIDERKSKEITIQLDSAVKVGFTPEVIVNNLAPAQYNFSNTTKGGSTFKWTFEGGEPSSSESKIPPTVTYTQAGTYTVILEVFNGSQSFRTSQTVKVEEATTADFEFIPFFENQDMETPLRARLNNRSTRALAYKWKCPGAVFVNDTARNTEVLFTVAGKHRLALEVWNGKQTITAQKDIEVKTNTNLYSLMDVKLGIRSAHDNIGCFFSGALRKTIPRNEVSPAIGADIDFAFFALNENFDHCRLLSILAAMYIQKVINNKTEYNVRIVGNTIAITVAVLAAPASGGTSLAAVSAAITVGAGAVAAIDIPIQCYKLSLQESNDFEKNKYWFDSWDYVYNTTAIVDLGAGATMLAVNVPRLAQFARSVEWTKKPPSLAKL